MRTSGIAGQWLLDGNHAIGTFAKDVSRHGNDGTVLTDNCSLTTGIHDEADGAIYSDGTYTGGEALSNINSGATIVNTSNPWSVSLLVKNDSTTDDTFLVSLPKDNWGGWAQPCMGIYLVSTTGKIIVFGRKSDDSGDVNTPQSTTSTNDGAWHHIVGQYTGTHLEVYVDRSREVNYDLAGQALRQGIGSFGICYLRGGGSAKFKGSIAKVLVYSYALTAGQIATLYNSYGV